MAPESSGPMPSSSDYDAAGDDRSVCWMVELDGDSAFARWLLTPA